MNVPIGILLLALGVFVLPNSKIAAGVKRSVDVMGASYFAASMLGVLYGMTELANNPNATSDPMMWASFGTGVVMLVLFLRHETRTPAPQ